MYTVSCTNWSTVEKCFTMPCFPISKLSYSFAVMPENSNFPYRRYDRLPPIHQFSIESDTDLSETAELIEEYEVFDPTRPRPKIILVIGMENGSLLCWLCLYASIQKYWGGWHLQMSSWMMNNDNQPETEVEGTVHRNTLKQFPIMQTCNSV